MHPLAWEQLQGLVVAPLGGACSALGAAQRGSGRSSIEKGVQSWEHESKGTGPEAEGAGDRTQDPAPPETGRGQEAKNRKDTPAP